MAENLEHQPKGLEFAKFYTFWESGSWKTALKSHHVPTALHQMPCLTVECAVRCLQFSFFGLMC
jgi:hypothetical protein